VKSSHGELVTKVKKRDSELVTCDEFTV